MSGSQGHDRRSIGAAIARCCAEETRKPEDLTERVLSEWEGRATHHTMKELAQMRRRRLALGTSFALLGLVAFLALGGRSAVASVVEAGKRWFHFGGDSPREVYLPDEPMEQVRESRATIRIVNTETGEETVQEVTVNEVGPSPAEMLEDLESGVAEGRYTVATERKTLGEAMASCAPEGEAPPPLEGVEADRVVDVHTFRDAEGAVVSTVAADPETHKLVSLLGMKHICVTATTGDGAGAEQSGTVCATGVGLTITVEGDGTVHVGVESEE